MITRLASLVVSSVARTRVSALARLVEAAFLITLLAGLSSAQALVNGGVVSAAIDVPGDEDVYTFSASAGENVILRVGDTGGTTLFPWLRVADPSGAAVDSKFGSAVAESAFVAGSSGTYTVVVDDASSGGLSTGPYDLHFVRAPGANEGGALPNGGDLNGSLTVGDLDSYSFAANAGENIIIRMGDVNGTSMFPWMRLFDPDGDLVDSQFGSAADEISAVAPQDGTYTLVVTDASSGFASTGSYELHFARMPGANEGGALPNGDSVLGDLTLGDLDSYTFTATAGESFLLRIGDLNGTSMFPWIRVYDPNGAAVDSQFGSAVDEISAVASLSGTYTIVITDASSGFGATGPYELHYVRAPGANEGGLLPNGGVVSETLALGDLDSYTFTAAAGESFVLRIGDVNGTSMFPWLRVYDPNGAQVDSQFGSLVDEVSGVAALTGVYTVVVADASSGFASTGLYDLHFVLAPGANEGGALPKGGSVTSTLTRGDLDSYTFSITAGQSFVLRAGDVNTTSLFPWLRVYEPNGALLLSNFGSATASIAAAAPTTGTYTVVLADASSGLASTGTYDLHFVQVPGANEGGLLLDGVVTADSITLGDLDSFTFLADAGDVAQVTVTDTAGGSLSPRVSLYDPNGAFVTAAGSSTTAVLTSTITLDGLHTLVVADQSSGLAATGPYTIVVNGSGAEPTDPINTLCPPELPTDPILADNGGSPGIGPKIGDPNEPFNVSLDCTGAVSPALYVMEVWTSKSAAPPNLKFGLLYLSGARLLRRSGTHNQSVETWFPAPAGLVVPNDTTLVGLSYAVQGYCSGYSPNGRLSSVVVQTIGI